MVKSLTSNALDEALNYIADRADLLSLCAGVPTDATEAAVLVGAGGRALASVVLTQGAGGGDFSVMDAQGSGRRLAIATQSAVPIAETGTVDHIALIDTNGGELLLVTQLTEDQPVTAGEIISVRAFGSQIQAPA